MADQDRDWPDQLQGMWDQIEERFRDKDDRADFVDRAQELFDIGWGNGALSTEEREDAWTTFFTHMEEFDISVEHFDWDDWRDWYNE